MVVVLVVSIVRKVDQSEKKEKKLATVSRALFTTKAPTKNVEREL